MNTLKLKENLLTRKILCSFFGHKLIVKRNITPNFSEFECQVCRLELTHDAKGKKTSLTPRLKEVNETLLNFHNRRHNIAV
jgi:hypothetical protein